MGNAVIDICSYKSGKHVKWGVASQADRSEVAAFHSRVTAIYRPHHTYVIDIARLVSGGLKIVEYNCLNCAGMYVCDRRAIFAAVLDCI